MAAPKKNTKRPAATEAPVDLTPPSPSVAPGVATLRELVAILEGSSLVELSYADDSLSVSLSKTGSNAVVAAAAPAPSPAAAPVVAPSHERITLPEESLTIVRSPFVGTFYRSPKPGAPSFTDVGERVRKGQTICIIEAMKLMNEIESEIDGAVAEILPENGQPVQYGDPLFKIRKG